MSTSLFAAAVLALLLAPGPTNTLMGVAGAQGGVKRVLRLLPAELAGYLAAILPLAFIGERVLGHWPLAAIALKALAALWVMVLAIGLWRTDGETAVADVSAGRIFLTTLLNPKALVFGLVLLPAPAEAGFVPHLGLFCLLVVAVALLWGAAGALTRLGGGGRQRLLLVRRAASLWLGFVSIGMVVGLAAP